MTIITKQCICGRMVHGKATTASPLYVSKFVFPMYFMTLQQSSLLKRLTLVSGCMVHCYRSYMGHILYRCQPCGVRSCYHGLSPPCRLSDDIIFGIAHTTSLVKRLDVDSSIISDSTTIQRMVSSPAHHNCTPVETWREGS